MKKYSIGIDFGTLSARAVLADVENGDILPAIYSFDYPHAVMSRVLQRMGTVHFYPCHQTGILPYRQLHKVYRVIPHRVCNHKLHRDGI